MFDSWLFWSASRRFLRLSHGHHWEGRCCGCRSGLRDFLLVIVVAVLCRRPRLSRGVARPLTALSARTLVFLALSGLGDRSFLACYYRALSLGPARVKPIDKLSIVLVAADQPHRDRGRCRQELYATRGTRHCAVESLERMPLGRNSGHSSTVHARGYLPRPGDQYGRVMRDCWCRLLKSTGVADAEVGP